MNKSKEDATRFVVLRLYKDLLRITKRFDTEPSSKALIYRNSVEPTSSYFSSSGYYNQILDEFLSKKNLFLPHHDTPSLHEIVRTNFRKPSSQPDNEEIAKRLDTAFSLFRKLNSVWKCFTSLESAYGKVKTPYLSPVSLASALGLSTSRPPSLPSVRLNEDLVVPPGTILVAHPMVQGPMHRSCILVVENSSKGSYGVVINQPTDHDLGYAVKNLPMDIYDKFHKANVSFGGMVRRLQYLHSIPSCGGIKIPGCSKPLFAGGDISKALSTVQRHPSLLKNFEFYVGCCKWESGQLQQEIERGFWISVQAQPDLIVSMSKFSLEQESTSFADDSDDSYSTSTTVDDIDKLEMQRMMEEACHEDEESSPDSSSTISTVTTTTTATTTATTTTTYNSSTLLSDASIMADLGTLSEDSLLPHALEHDPLPPPSPPSSPPSSPSPSHSSANESSSTVAQYSASPGHEKSNTLITSTSGVLKKTREHPPSQRYGRSGTMTTHTVDVWRYIMDNLGGKFQCFSDIPHYLDTSNVESCDWK
jgi:putative transcriptional regulator